MITAWSRQDLSCSCLHMPSCRPLMLSALWLADALMQRSVFLIRNHDGLQMPSGIDLCFLWLADAFMPATGDAVRTALAGEAGLDPITKNGRAPVLGENLWQGTLHANSVYCDVTASACSTEAVAQASTVTLCMRHACAQLAQCILQFDVGSCCDDSCKLGGWEALGTQGVVRAIRHHHSIMAVQPLYVVAPVVCPVVPN